MAISAERRARLEAAGFKIGTVDEFLGLTPEESALVEVKLALGTALKRQRTDLQLSQELLAGQLHSSQSRIAKMEAADPSVSIDLLVRALLAAGISREELGQIIATGSSGNAERQAKEAPKDYRFSFEATLNVDEAKL